MERFSEVVECWKKAREDLRSPHHLPAQLEGEKLIPDWRVSPNIRGLNTQSGQDSWEFYNASCLPRDQAALLQTSFIRLEEHASHSLIQAANFVRALSLRCAGFRRNQTVAERRSHDLLAKRVEFSSRAQNLETQLASLEARNKELEEKMDLEISQAMNAGKEIGFSAGHAVGKITGAIEGREDFLKSEDFAGRIREARY
ncbi:UNVERIFIED_CONTAM: hypothetical protein Sindi_0456300 [Sesamum indicum]